MFQDMIARVQAAAADAFEVTGEIMPAITPARHVTPPRRQLVREMPAHNGILLEDRAGGVARELAATQSELRDRDGVVMEADARRAGAQPEIEVGAEPVAGVEAAELCDAIAPEQHALLHHGADALLQQRRDPARVALDGHAT